MLTVDDNNYSYPVQSHTLTDRSRFRQLIFPMLQIGSAICQHQEMTYPNQCVFEYNRHKSAYRASASICTDLLRPRNKAFRAILGEYLLIKQL